MFRRKIERRFYHKAPSKSILRQARNLKKVAFFSFLLSLLFMVLSNPFESFAVWQKVPKNQAEWQKVIASIPEFIKVFPSEAEKSSFAFFDWTKEQLNNSWPIFAKETVMVDKEAGQSAVAPVTPKVDYVSLPFFIEIPKFGVFELVKPNVNPNNPKEYKVALESGVAHALGSAFPPEQKMVYIFGHSTDGIWNVEAYNAVFYQIKDLVIGDPIIIHLGDKDYVYKVSAKDTIKDKQADYVNNLKDQNILLLQTCWPPGTSWQRLFIQATPVTNQ